MFRLKNFALVLLLSVTLGITASHEACAEIPSGCENQLIRIERGTSQQGPSYSAIGSLAWFGWFEQVDRRHWKLERELPLIDMVDVNPLHIQRVSGIG